MPFVVGQFVDMVIYFVYSLAWVVEDDKIHTDGQVYIIDPHSPVMFFLWDLKGVDNHSLCL